MGLGLIAEQARLPTYNTKVVHNSIWQNRVFSKRNAYITFMYISNMTNIFVYGTLLDDTVRGRVLGKHVKGKSDTLEDYIIDTHSVLTSYPTIVQQDKGFVNGKYFDVDMEDIKKLDRYESEYYKKIEVKLKSGVDTLVYTERIYM
jgi:gamma-glutamylcyclotransferase (GGCT)/AIG2-like uncharacterized protein YtfP